MNAKIYKIVDVGYEKCYVGSTCEELSQRMARHRQTYYFNEKHVQNKHSNSRVLFDEYGVENCKIELIENYPCDSKEQLLRREGYHIQNIECVNRCVAGRTPKEYKELYNPLNREKIKNGMKEWYQNNKEEHKQHRKEYYQINREQILEQNKQNVACEVCGLVGRKSKLSRHQKTIKCQSYKSNDNEHNVEKENINI